MALQIKNHKWSHQSNHIAAQAQDQWRERKSRVFSPSQGKARFRDNLPGLKNEIHNQTKVQSKNVSLPEKMSSSPVWQNLLATVGNNTDSDISDNSSRCCTQ
jgi:hypothetical protein